MYYSPVRHSTKGLPPFRVRLACVRHAASVQSEPGSNSSVQSLFQSRVSDLHPCLRKDAYSILKESTRRKSLTSNISTSSISSKYEHQVMFENTSSTLFRTGTVLATSTSPSTHTYRLLIFKEQGGKTELRKTKLVAGAGFEPTTFGL